MLMLVRGRHTFPPSWYSQNVHHIIHSFVVTICSEQAPVNVSCLNQHLSTLKMYYKVVGFVTPFLHMIMIFQFGAKLTSDNFFKIIHCESPLIRTVMINWLNECLVHTQDLSIRISYIWHVITGSMAYELFPHLGTIRYYSTTLYKTKTAILDKSLVNIKTDDQMTWWPDTHTQ